MKPNFNFCHSLSSLLILSAFLLSAFSATATPKPSFLSCKKLLGQCSFYNCVESKVQCGPESYLQNFAEKYCHKYEETEYRYTEAGQEFLRNIRECLQNELYKNLKNLSCDSMKPYAISTHEKCYEQFNFCDLPLHDQILIKWTAKFEILDPEIFQFALHLELMCHY